MSEGYDFKRTDWLALLFTFLSISMTFIIFSSVAVPTITCTIGSFVKTIGTNNDTCNSTSPISFKNTYSNFLPASNCGTGVTSISLTGVSVTIGDVIVVAFEMVKIPNGGSLGAVTTLTDTVNTYGRQVLFGTGTAAGLSTDLWATRALSTATLTLTANINVTVGVHMLVSTYGGATLQVTPNALATGQVAGAGSNLQTLSFSNIKSGSWLVGTSSSTINQNLVPGTGQTQRIMVLDQICQLRSDMEDKIANIQTDTFSVDFGNVVNARHIAAVEIVPNTYSSGKQSGSFTATWATGTTVIVTGNILYPQRFTTGIPTITITPRAGTNLRSLLPGASYTFFALTSTGQTWANMPAVKTEIFGDTGQHQLLVDFSTFQPGSIGNVIWQVNCLVPSTSATAFLRPEYFDTVGGTWKELAAVTTTLDIAIGTQQVSCLAALPSTLSSPPAPVVNAVAGVSSVQLRIAGFNGAGVGDSPSFTAAQLTTYTPFQFSPACGENLAPSSTAFSWRCTILVPLGASQAPQSITVDWAALAA